MTEPVISTGARLRRCALGPALALALLLPACSGTPAAPRPTTSPTAPTVRTTASRATGSSNPAWQASLGRSMPADLPSTQSGASEVGSTACTAPPSAGWLAAENRRPGTAIPLDGATFAYSDAIRAYPTRTSVRCGQPVPVAVSAPSGRYVLRAWRVGSYAGRGARVVWTSPPFTAHEQHSPAGQDLVAAGPGWATTLSAPTADWLPGLYLLEVVGSGGTQEFGGWVPVVVRGGEAGGYRAPAVYVAPTLTWAAYNPDGGASLYRAFSGSSATAYARRARVVALARPSVLNGQRQVAEYTVPLVAAIERAGVDVDYVADTDVDATPSLLAGRAEVVVGSHAEYVTTRVYDAFEAARNAGVNLAFLGGNQFYWHVALARDAEGVPTSVTLHRELAEDPQRGRSPADVTVRWRDAPLNRPEAVLIGAQYSGLGVRAPLLTLQPPAWTTWPPGTVITDAAAGEVDAPTKASPPRTQVLAASTTRRGRAWVDAATTYYVAPSGAAVVDIGTMDAGCLIQNSCAGMPVPAATSTAVGNFVTAVVTGFASPGFGTGHPVGASAGSRLSGAAFARQYGARGIGVDLKDDDD